MPTPFKVIILLQILFSSNTLFSQLETVEDIRKKYDVVTDHISGLYNGPKYQPDAVLYDEGTPFLYSYLQPGSVQYDGNKYDSIQLLYDLVKDEIVLLHYNGSGRIQLIKEKVKEFAIADRMFINVNPVQSKETGIPDGYYEVVYKGLNVLLKKNYKVLQTNYTSQSGRVDVFDRQKYFLIKDGKSNQVSGRKAFLNLLNKKDVDSKLKKAGINYRNNQEEYMKQALQLTEQTD